ncbi:MAG: hypothetical protein Q6360_13085 [Candidatus Brocadiales bacterium]|nr:hypothetical protein [Candidatus Brocadiales bacterium]
MAIANTITYETIYEDILQDRLDRPTTWKELCDVTIMNTRVLSSSYMSTTPTVNTVTRGTGLVANTFAETAESMTISTGRDIGLFVDWADLAQSDWTKPAELFDRIGALLNEYIESNFLARHASWTNFGTVDIGGGGTSTSTITISASNIDDVIRGVKREIREGNGQLFMNMNGVGFCWRAADFEYLEAFVQANGFMTADDALKEGTVEGLRYLGCDHYWSNDHTANHVFAGVKKIERMGILRGTYGKAHTIDFPAADTNTYLSGQSFYSRVDVGNLTPSAHSGIVFDVNVA